MRRLLALSTALALSFANGSASAQVGQMPAWPPIQPTSVPYVGPCDVGGNVTCAVAWSPARAMTSAYSGNLFQLMRASDLTTLNVGQTGAHVADLSGVYTFCKGTYCWYSKLYDHIASNDLVYANSGMASVLAACNNTTGKCAPNFTIDPATNTPIIRTTYPSGFALAADTTVTGVNAGANAVSFWQYGRDEGWTDCCGTPGLSHAFSAGNTIGTYFGQWNKYGQADNTFFECASTTTQCAGVSWESADRDGADYSPSPVATGTHDLAGLITWDGASATDTIKIYADSATPIYSKSPPCPVINTAPCAFGVNTINVGTHVHYGFGGDTSQIDKVFRDVLISNNVLNGSDFTNLQSNANSFYAASAPTCKGPAGLGFQWALSGGHDAFYPPLNSLVAYGLYQMRADYYGPIADLRDSAGTVNTYGPASSGCAIDTAAATFCAANPPCTVAKLYNQGSMSTVGNKDRDSNLDMVQATTAKQPSVSFAALNGRPIMHFSGTQTLASANPSNANFTVSIMSMVARRTGNLTSFNEVFTQYPNSALILGFDASADHAQVYDGATSVTTSATDNHYHSVVGEYDNTGGGAGRLYVDGVAGGTTAIGALANHFFCIGIACDGTTQPFIGDVAEVEALTNFKPGSAANQGWGYNPQNAAIFTAHENAWGTLPN